VTTWSADRRTLKVEWPDQQDELIFGMGADGRTHLKLLRNEKAVADLK
jgi:hypothetical protein